MIMDDPDQKEETKKTYLAERDDWTFSSDPRVQAEQLQGALGAKSGRNISVAGNNSSLQQEKERKDDKFFAFAMAAEEAKRAYDEASQSAKNALQDFGSALDDAQVLLTSAMKEIKENIITLDDGTEVFYNTKTGEFERQDAHGNWHALEDDDEIAQAFESARRNGGKAATRQGKEMLDQWQEEIDAGRAYKQDREEELAQIDEAVENGKTSHEDGTKQKQEIEEDIREQTERMSDHGLKNHSYISAVKTRNEFRGLSQQDTHNSLSETHSNKTVNNLFGDGNALETNSQSRMSAAGSAFPHIEKIAGCYNDACAGISKPEEQKPENQPKPAPQNTMEHNC